jgi:hypothetical protein
VEQGLSERHDQVAHRLGVFIEPEGQIEFTVAVKKREGARAVEVVEYLRRGKTGTFRVCDTRSSLLLCRVVVRQALNQCDWFVGVLSLEALADIRRSRRGSGLWRDWDQLVFAQLNVHGLGLTGEADAVDLDAAWS